MNTRWRRGFAVLLVTCELVTAAYLALFTLLFTVWYLDDSVAARMGPADWYREGLIRFVWAILAAALFGGLCFLANRRFARALLPSRPRAASWIGAGLGVALAVVGFFGSLRFVIEKPYM